MIDPNHIQHGVPHLDHGHHAVVQPTHWVHDGHLVHHTPTFFHEHLSGTFHGSPGVHAAPHFPELTFKF